MKAEASRVRFKQISFSDKRKMINRIRRKIMIYLNSMDDSPCPMIKPPKRIKE